MSYREFEAQHLQALRHNFLAEFDRELDAANIVQLPTFFDLASVLGFKATIQCWTNMGGTLAMVLEEMEEAESNRLLDFSYFVHRAGVDYIHILHMKIRNVDRHVPFVIECYRRYLIDRETEGTISAFIESYERGEQGKR